MPTSRRASREMLPSYEQATSEHLIPLLSGEASNSKSLTDQTTISPKALEDGQSEQTEPVKNILGMHPGIAYPVAAAASVAVAWTGLEMGMASLASLALSSAQAGSCGHMMPWLLLGFAGSLGTVPGILGRKKLNRDEGNIRKAAAHSAFYAAIAHTFGNLAGVLAFGEDTEVASRCLAPAFAGSAIGSVVEGGALAGTVAGAGAGIYYGYKGIKKAFNADYGRIVRDFLSDTDATTTPR